jgi:hypothetical protein
MTLDDRGYSIFNRFRGSFSQNSGNHGSTAAAVVKHLPRPFSPDDRGYSELNRFRGL